jgi:transposase
MITLKGETVYLACGRTDMRKSINGLVAIIESSFKMDPFNGTLFVFCNKNRDRIKIIEWDSDGFWLHFKRLERGHIKWPEAGDETTLTLSPEEFAVLLGGTKVESKLKRREVTQRQVV